MIICHIFQGDEPHNLRNSIKQQNSNNEYTLNKHIQTLAIAEEENSQQYYFPMEKEKRNWYLESERQS